MHCNKPEENMLVISKCIYYFTVLTNNIRCKQSFFQKTIESETVKTSEIFKKKLGTISETVKEVKRCYRYFLLLFDKCVGKFSVKKPPLMLVCHHVNRD